VRPLLRSIRIGSLLHEVSQLRAFHRDQVLDENRSLDEGMLYHVTVPSQTSAYHCDVMLASCCRHRSSINA